MMTCCTFVYSVINSIQSKQKVFSHSLSNYEFIEIIISLIGDSLAQPSQTVGSL
jgi:hypothetical protein